MALLGSSATTSQSLGLTPTYINQLIRGTLTSLRQPIYALTAQRDELNVKKAIYSDLKSRLLTLQTITDDLGGDNATTVFDDKAAVSSNTGVLTATATSEAATGEYTISVTNLAEAHMVRSDQQTSSSEALSLSGTFSLNGVSINVGTTDSLDDIMDAVNNADYEDGKEVVATIVDNNLVLEAAGTGTSSQLTASDSTGSVLSDLGILDGGSFKTTLQAAEDASFVMNDITITRESNTGLDDVINGVTLSLLSETEGEDTVQLEISPDYANIRAKISAFVNNLNDVISYLAVKTQTTVNQDNETYTRGALAGETIFSKLRADLVMAVRQQTTIEPLPDDPAYLADVGISVGNGLSISLDTSELDSALQANFDGVVRLFEGVMDRFQNILEPFTTATSSSNTIDLYSNSIDTKVENIDSRIGRMEKMLDVKEEMLVTQYSSLYMQNIQFTQQQYGMLDIYSNFSIMA